MKKFQAYMTVVALGMLLMACKTSEQAAQQGSADDLQALTELLEGKQYKIEVEAVIPQHTAASLQVTNKLLLPGTVNTAGRIDTRGQGHYLEMRQDSVAMRLPFIGEVRQTRGDLYSSGQQGVKVNDVYTDYKLKADTKRKRMTVTFVAEEAGEAYDVTMTVFPSKRALIMLASTHRNFISYQGRLVALE